MSSKRQQREESSSNNDKGKRRFPTFQSVVADVMHLQRLQNLMVPVLEPLIRRVVKEELDVGLRKYIISRKRNWGKDVELCETRSLQLQFLSTISPPVFTGTRIEAEGCTTIEVALVDALTEQVVSTGCGSSAKVEIVVLEGDFDVGETWTSEEFTNNIVREREGKKPLLAGDMCLTLKDGTGLVGDLLFTDNSSWTRSRKFRLGARVVEDLGRARVREARSEPFVVRDHRGELYKKHHPPALRDEVWRLEKIGKDGAFHKRLSKERVQTVQDFLVFLSLSPAKLRHILGTGMSSKMWEVTVEHAQTCVVDNKLYLYNSSRSLQRSGVVFNSIGQVAGIYSNDQYVPTDRLSEAEKADARSLVISAFGDREKIILLDNDTSLNTSDDAQCSTTSISSASYPQGSTSHRIEKLYASTPDYMHSIYSIGGFDDDFLHDIDLSEIASYDQTVGFDNEFADLCDTDSVTRAFSFSGNEHLNKDNSLHPVDLPRKGWRILGSVVKWCFIIKGVVAKKSHGEISK